jgi:hypothetical protein
MDAFWGITLSLLVLRWWYKNHHVEKPRVKPNLLPKTPANVKTQEVLRAQEQARQQRERDVEALRKQGYTDELIATILPVVNDK